MISEHILHYGLVPSTELVSSKETLTCPSVWRVSKGEANYVITHMFLISNQRWMLVKIACECPGEAGFGFYIYKSALRHHYSKGNTV